GDRRVALPHRGRAARQPSLRGAGGAGQEPVRLPVAQGPRTPGRLEAAAALAEALRPGTETHARTDPAPPRPRRTGAGRAIRPGPPAVPRRPRRGRGRRALAVRTAPGTRLRAVLARPPHPRDPGNGALGAGLCRPAP